MTLKQQNLSAVALRLVVCISSQAGFETPNRRINKEKRRIAPHSPNHKHWRILLGLKHETLQCAVHGGALHNGGMCEGKSANTFITHLAPPPVGMGLPVPSVEQSVASLQHRDHWIIDVSRLELTKQSPMCENRGAAA
ncbi:hypothetical protein AAFF_G00092070 [Aldrovandia affinis]|uniref:Uncharacterized protein n=1 Tax=Aldrovandia affinis TaxID=143900 RepID=A0AAD7T4D2_9TELE|nr:hypothetical protein AAFF_G00092070 [Aldrovandia affinis]